MKIVLNQAYSFCQQGQRDYQEDARWPDADTSMTSQRFFIVCDGVGGSEAGEVASRTICRSMAASIEDIDLGIDFTPAVFSEIFDAAYNKLDSIANDSNRDMATTMVLACFHSGGCTMAHIGDSRIYQYRQGEGIIYKSDDHSLVNDLVHEGKLAPEKAEHHPKGNVITKYMSPVSDDEERWEATMVTTTDVMQDDVFILCTDGVTSCISDNHLIEILDSDLSYEDKLKQISVECRNSSDNNTCYLIPVKEVSDISGDDSKGKGSVITKRLKRPAYETLEIESVKRPNTKGILERIKNFFNY